MSGRIGSRDHGGLRGGSGGPPYRGGKDQAKADTEKALMDRGKIVWFSGGEKPELLPAILGSEAEKRARSLERVKPTQIRRFFAPVVALKQRLAQDGDSISDLEIQAQVQQLRAKAAYAGAREQPTELVTFITQAANSVSNKRDFDAFARHFECVVAFHRVYCLDKD